MISIPGVSMVTRAAVNRDEACLGDNEDVLAPTVVMPAQLHTSLSSLWLHTGVHPEAEDRIAF